MKTTSRPILTSYIIAATYLLYLSSCIKPFEPTPQPPITLPCDTCLPPITTSGKNTFGCKVNGKVWLPKDGWMSPGIRLSYYNDILSISAYNNDKNSMISFSLGILSDTIELNFPTIHIQNSRATYGIIINDTNFQFEAEPIVQGRIIITKFDTLNSIFSGQFSFNVYDKYNTSNGDTIFITDGRFDIRK